MQKAKVTDATFSAFSMASGSANKSRHGQRVTPCSLCEVFQSTKVTERFVRLSAMATLSTTRMELVDKEQSRSWIGYAPIVVLPLAVGACRDLLPPWVFMWLLSFAIFMGLKWPTWWKARGRGQHTAWRSVAYLLAWPGMDAEAFLGHERSKARIVKNDGQGEAQRVGTTPWQAWLWAFVKTAMGAALIWIVARHIPANDLLLRGWTGMLGLILLLHFGSFDLLAFFWRALGVDAEPIMCAPIRSTSLSEFWGKRWNLGFRQVSHEFIFRPLQKCVGPGGAGFVVFLFSGLIHEAAISLPARGGYGLPTAYFVLQALGINIERSRVGKRLGLRHGWRGWLFTAAITLGPVFLLFHRPFVLRVILPFLHALGAL